MAIYRGTGGAGDATTDATVSDVTEQAVIATNKASEAAASATGAANSASSASSSATAAASSASSAATSASTATTKASEASSSATAAASSASAASTSETNAATSATNAASSETAASASETAAASSATSASTSATNAATSATNASNSASAASTSASNASTSESNAATSASNAATSESNASSSATAAASSATAAAGSASAASASADAALAALDNFDDRYLGQKATAPTVDNDGDALVTGALYFDTTDDAMKVWDGTQWLAAYASLSGALIANNNLSDLSDASAARTNLGLGTAATTNSTAYATAAQGTLADSALQNVSEDTTPQLGGNLDTNGNDIAFGDNDKATFGASSDLQIYHDGSNSYVKDAGAGSLVLQGASFVLLQSNESENMVRGQKNAGVDLYYDNLSKLTTTATGVDVTGTVTADGLTVDQSTLHVDATNNRVGIRTTTPNDAFQVNGGALSVTADNNAYANEYFAKLKSEIGPIPLALETRVGDVIQASNYGQDLTLLTGLYSTGTVKRLKIAYNGDLSLYEDTGTTAKFHWDASAESLGIGTLTPTATLHAQANQNGGIRIQRNSTTSGTYGQLEFLCSTADTAEANLWVRGTRGSAFDDNHLSFGTGGSAGSERMRIDSSGNVGIGTSNITDGNLQIGEGNSTFNISVAGPRAKFGYDGNVVVQGGTSKGIKFCVNDSTLGSGEAMRIDSSGNLLVGKTSAGSNIEGVELVPQGAIYAARSSNVTGVFNRKSSDGDIVHFRKDGTNVGSVSVSGSTTSYNTSSDERLKDNIADANDAGDKIDAIKVRQYDWKADGSHQDYGMIAQELMTVAPEAVSGDPESDEMMGVDYSKLVPMLIKEVQSLRARVAQLETGV